MLNRANVKYGVDVFASLAIVVACAVLIWTVVSSRGTADVPTGSGPSALPPVQSVADENLTVSLVGAPLLGEASAQIVLIELSDFECPFCRQYAALTFGEVKRKFVDSGIISYSYIHYPLVRRHKSALAAARVAECASDQGKFWQVHEALF